MKKKIILFLAGGGSFFIVIIFCVLVLFGAASSFADAIKNFFHGNDETKEMTEEEFAVWINDPENIYEALQSDDVDLSAVNFLMLDEDTVKQIFERIHVYDEKRKESKTVSYTYRTETRKPGESFEDMDEYGTIPSDSSSGKSGISYSGKADVEISRGSVEKETDENGMDLFALRWQPIVSMCALAVQQEYDDWGKKGGEDISTETIEDADLTNYYLTDEEIDKIIDIFYYKATYYYDAISSSTSSYKFKRMPEIQCAYRLDVSEDDDTRVTKRIPCSAPLCIANGFISYDYKYNSSGQCTSRDYTVVSERFFSAAAECVNNFDMDMYLSMLSELPSAEDLYEFYSSDDFVNMMLINTTCMDPKQCSSIGIYYNANASSGGDGGDIPEDSDSVGFIEYNGETYGVPYYDYVAADRKLYVDRVEGQEYGLYQVDGIALKSGAQTDGLTAEQIEYAISNCSYYADSGCILFDTEEHRAKTAEILYEYQEEKNISVFFLLGIMRTEGAIKGPYGHDYYNYFNIKGSPHISGKGFKNYKAAYGDGFTCLEEQLDFIVDKYINNGKSNYFKMSWNGYDGRTLGSLDMCYCPYYDDFGMPWAAGSLRLNSSGEWKTVTPGIGWVNSNADFRAQLENIVKEGYPDWDGNPFVLTEETVGETFGDKLKDFFSNLFGGSGDDDDGDDDDDESDDSDDE